MMLRLILVSLCFSFFLESIASEPTYKVSIDNKRNILINAMFTLSNDTIFIYQRGTTPELPEGEAGFVKDLIVKDKKGRPITYNYAGEGNWILKDVKADQEISIEYRLLTTHQQYNWDHTGGIDEAAFEHKDGFFFTGYSFFIIPSLEMKNIAVQFYMPAGWKASTPWKIISPVSYVAESGRFLVNNCFMLGLHQESIVRVNDMEMRLALTSELSYARPLIERTMRKLLPAYQKMFGGTPAPTYLVTMSKERMTDGSAFRRSFSQIFKDSIDEKGMVTWGYIMAHEILHLWNGHALVPGTQEEWFKEGFTDYLTMVTMRKENLIDDEYVYRKLEHIARRYWLDRFWQRDTLSIRESGDQKEKFRFGVYGGGAAVAIALEIEMRNSSNNKKGIVDLMKRMYTEFATGGTRYTLDDIIRIANEESGTDLRWFFKDYVTGKKILDLHPYYAQLGLDFHTVIEEVYITPIKKATTVQHRLYKKIFVE